MSDDEVLSRLSRTVVFGGLCACGFWLIFGFGAKIALLSLVVVASMFFSTFTSLAMLFALAVFAVGVATWAGFAPSGVSIHNLLPAGGFYLPTAEKADTTPHELSEKLRELAKACESKLLSESDCTTMRESVIANFTNRR